MTDRKCPIDRAARASDYSTDRVNRLNIECEESYGRY